MRKIRVALWGLGAMGSGMARLVLEKEGLELAGGIDVRADFVGKDLGEVLGIGRALGLTVTNDPSTLLHGERVDLVVIATTSWLKEQMPDLRRILTAGVDCISIAEEMASPEAQSPELAAEIDALAKANGVTILGTGVNPGFVLDLLVILLSGVCHQVDRIEARRVNDLSPYGPTVMKAQGVGTTPEEFAAGVADGTIVGHVGFPESIRMISDALGLGVTRIEQGCEPIVSKGYRDTAYVKIVPGVVAGSSHLAAGYAGEKQVVRLVHSQQVHPYLEGQGTGDYIDIYGKPEIHLSTGPEIAGGVATVGLAVNMIPHVVAATPGLKAMVDLPVPAALAGESAYRRRV